MTSSEFHFLLLNTKTPAHSTSNHMRGKIWVYVVLLIPFIQQADVVKFLLVVFESLLRINSDDYMCWNYAFDRTSSC